MVARSPFQFSLSRFFVWLAAASIAFGALCAFLRAQKGALQDARLQAQERLVDEIGGNVVGYAKASRVPICVDLADTTADPQWISRWLTTLKYSGVRIFIVDAAFTRQPGFAELRERFPNVDFIIVTRSKKLEKSMEAEKKMTPEANGG